MAGSLLVAGVAVPVWQQGRIEKLTTESVSLRGQVDEMIKLREETQKGVNMVSSGGEAQNLRETNEKLKKEILELRGRVSAATTATIKAQAQTAIAQEKSETNSLPAGINGFMKGIVEQQIMGKLTAMKSKVKLTDQQEESIREILRKQMEQAVELSQKMISGKMSKDEMVNMQKGGGNPEEQIKALLTPEQLTLYKEYKTEETTSNARLAANGEMLLMQNALSLTQDQQDQVYKALYEVSYNQLSGKLAEDMPKNSDTAAVMKWQVDRKVKALEKILSPEQLQKYREQQENQAKLITSMMPGDQKKGQ